MMKYFAALALATMSAVPVFAAQDAPPPAAKKPTKDPNRMVCETQEVLGSRLATRRVCMTAAEWADLRARDRQAIDQGQRNACVRSAGC